MGPPQITQDPAGSVRPLEDIYVLEKSQENFKPEDALIGFLFLKDHSDGHIENRPHSPGVAALRPVQRPLLGHPGWAWG